MSGTVHWFEAKPAPLVLVVGPESYLASKSIRTIREQLRQANPELEVSEIQEGTYTAGKLFDFASPSLFAEPRMVIIHGAGEGLLEDLKQLLADPVDGCTVVVRLPNMVGHSGKIRKELAKQALSVSCEELKKDSERIDFVKREFTRAGVPIDQQAIRALISAFSSDLGELGAACSQLSSTHAKVALEDVEAAFGGRVETNAFKIADAALSGNAAEAIRLFRHGFATGIDSVALVAALSMRIRQLARLFNDRNASPATLGMQPWQIDKARKELSGWQEQELAGLVQLAAQTDADVKGASRDPEYSVERLLLAMARAN
ncbi:MAG: DNA polymerase III subunit delta [Candidatus Aquiluna sp. XM-24bin5]|nr:MAG: DNA polymerase III subunit delta [Candidatus Aquiluna sp. XM-24bin5]